MNKLVAIEHSETLNKNTTLVNWCLGNTCNYRCSYCPESLHSGNFKWVDYELAIGFCNKLIEHYKNINQKIEFLFTGGEPTMFHDFPILLKELKKANCTIGVISNGSRSLNWWQDNLKLFDNVILTYHSEYAEIYHFIELINMLSNEVNLHISITMLPSNFDECFKTAKLISESTSNASISLKPLLKDFGVNMYDYDNNQLNVLNSFKFNNSKKYPSTRGMMKEIYSDKEIIKYKAVDFILKDKNHWKNWHCNIGIELIYIDYKGDVYRGTCKQGGKITNIFNYENFSFPTDAILCSKETCHCLADIMTSKYSPIEIDTKTCFFTTEK